MEDVFDGDSDELDDLADVGAWHEGAALWSSDWTAETAYSQIRRGNINLSPEFQRRSAWSKKKQSLFIESLILGLPIPQIILAEEKGRKGRFIVIDGKQRLLALQDFFGAADFEDIKGMTLSGLVQKTNLNGKKYSQISTESQFYDDFNSLLNSNIRTVVIRNWQDESYLYEVFLRINTSSVPLSPQELRQALLPGPFSTFINKASASSKGVQKILGLKAPDSRMRDAELLLRYYAYKNLEGKYNGNLKLFLDETTGKFNETWENSEANILKQLEELEAAIIFSEAIFGEKNYFRKWKDERFEPRKNRAVIDIMAHYFSFGFVRDALNEKQEEILIAFKKLCEDNYEFIESLEHTTKSIDANEIRFGEWGKELSKIANIEMPIPKFRG